MLVTVVQPALNQNLDLDAALARVRQARAAASGAGAELLPTADLGASATFEHQSLRGEFGSVAAGSPAGQPKACVVHQLAGEPVPRTGGVLMAVVSNNRNRREHYIFNLWVVNISRDKHFEMSFGAHVPVYKRAYVQELWVMYAGRFHKGV